jgi:hypothetical protein
MPSEICQGDCERWVLKRREEIRSIAEKVFEQSGLQLPKMQNSRRPSVPDSLSAELVPDISQDERPVRTSEISVPCTLSQAVESQFLSTVVKERWWEALGTIHLSRQGCHAVLLMSNGNTSPNDYDSPLLASSALIQGVPETVIPDEDTLLTRDPLFRGRVWKILLDKNTIAEQLSLYADDLKRDFGLNLGVDLSRIPENLPTNEELEEGIVRAVGAENITEFIRLTGDDSNRAKYIYHGLKYFSALQIEKKIPFSFGVTYETLADTFDVLGRLHGAPCCIRLSEHRLKPNEPKTQKILILNGNLAKAMEAADWRHVAMAVRRMNRSRP